MTPTFWLPPTLVCLALLLFWLPRHERPVWLWTLLVWGWLASSTLWKCAMIQDHLDSPVNLPALHWMWQAWTVLGCLLMAQLLHRRHWLRLAWLAQAGMASIFLIDQLYERYFDDIPGLYLVTQLSQAKAVLPSAIELLRQEDLAFLADVLVTLPILFFKPPEVVRKKVLPWLLLPLTATVTGLASINADDWRILKLRFRNVAAVQRLGLYHYHAYDLMQMVYSRWENVVDRSYNKPLLDQLLKQSRESIAAPTPWKGRYKGKNLLVFQLESFEWFLFNREVDGQAVTPFLNELAKKSWVAGLQDQSGQGRSSDGEFILLNSLLPPGERPLVYAYPSNYWHGLPMLLFQEGYFTSYAVPYYGSFWNARYMAKRYGFKRNLFREQIPNDPRYTIGWGLSDFGLVNRLHVYWAQFQKPFFAYTVTLMGHHPYRELTRRQEQLKLPAKLKETMLARYLQLARERDTQWRQIVELLKREGLWDSSIVVLVGDHDARIPYEEMKLIWPKGSYDEVDKIESDRVFCLIHTPDEKLVGQGPDYSAQLDLTPTLLHLLGLTDKPTATLGLNLLSEFKRESIVSKTGYSMDNQYVVLDRGGSYSAYARSNHLSTTQVPLAQKDLVNWYDLSRDILRLNLVPTMLKQ